MVTPEQWNALVPVGTPVRFFGALSHIDTVVMSKAWTRDGITVVNLERLPGCVPVSGCVVRAIDMAAKASLRESERWHAEALDRIAAWKLASGLIDGAGDPDGVKPEHLDADLRERDREREQLRCGLAWAMTSVCDHALDDGGCDGGWEDDCPHGEGWARRCRLAKLGD